MSNFDFEQRIAALETQIALFKQINQLPVRANMTGQEYMPISTSDGAGGYTEEQTLATNFFGDLLGNTPAKIRAITIDYDAAGTTAEKIRVAVNAAANYPISQGTLYLFKTNRIVLTNSEGDGIPLTDTDNNYAVISEYHVLGQAIAMINGSASIGVSGTTILEGNILYLTTSDFRSFASTEFDLGDIGAATIEAAVNGGVARSTPQEATIYFKALQNAVNKLWLYQGAGIEVGTGKPPTVAGDYRLFPDAEDTDPNPPYQETRPGTTKTLGNLFGNINLSNFEEFEDKLGWSIIPAYGTRYEVLNGKHRKKINVATQPTVRTSYVISAGSFVIGAEYTIKTVGTTDFTLIGASANTIDVIFTATGVGTGTGDAYKQALHYGGDTFAPNTNMFMHFIGRYGDNVEYYFESIGQFVVVGDYKLNQVGNVGAPTFVLDFDEYDMWNMVLTENCAFTVANGKPKVVTVDVTGAFGITHIPNAVVVGDGYNDSVINTLTIHWITASQILVIITNHS
tara:strand:- start:27433 stop:28968 length:1536 start_codon:yes stop_codon:yes gene_type:complete